MSLPCLSMLDLQVLDTLKHPNRLLRSLQMLEQRNMTVAMVTRIKRLVEGLMGVMVPVERIMRLFPAFVRFVGIVIVGGFVGVERCQILMRRDRGD